MDQGIDIAIGQAAEVIASADALLVATGAGMGVDSGLPDFRGREGFWRAYPAYKDLGLDFSKLANPQTFREAPDLAWGFYGHRLGLYRRAQPHSGFAILRQWIERTPHGGFVFTSNVDGHFQRAGSDPDRIVEVHGRIERMQCTSNCGIGIFSADDVDVAIDETTMRAQDPLPRCPSCGGLARPNILMFGDWEWDATITRDQESRLQAWLRQVQGRRLVVVECGAGTAIPTVRLASEDLCDRLGATLIRINPHESEVPSGHLGLPVGARDGIHAIHKLLEATS